MRASLREIMYAIMFSSRKPARNFPEYQDVFDSGQRKRQFRVVNIFGRLSNGMSKSVAKVTVFVPKERANLKPIDISDTTPLKIRTQFFLFPFFLTKIRTGC